MIESPDFYLKYERMTPYQRNQELKGLFNLLPDYDALWAYDDDVDRGEFTDLVQKIEDRGCASPFRQSLRNRLAALFRFSLTTNSSQQFLTRKYEQYLKIGICRTELLSSPPEFDIWGKELRWDSLESGGMFEKDEAQEVDRDLYKRALENVIHIRELEEKVLLRMELNQNISKELANAIRDFYSRKRKLSESELVQLGISERLVVLRVESMWKKTLEEIQLVEKWRNEHIKSFGDEP